MRVSGSLDRLERITTGLLGLVVSIENMIHFLLKSGEDAPQWEEGAGGVKAQPGGSLGWLNLQITWTETISRQ